MGANKPIIEVLNDLIQVNNDRIEGYQKAINNIGANNVMLKTLFYQIAEESHSCKRELTEKVVSLGGEPADAKTTVAGRVYRVWMDIKATFTGHDTNSTLNACEFGEDAAQKAYKEAIKLSENYPDEIRDLIRSQKNLLRMSHDLIRNMRDQYHEVEETSHANQ
jgi:uncharacterized protein (TIGR02284 family)